jgi:hypothetical protein
MNTLRGLGGPDRCGALLGRGRAHAAALRMGRGPMIGARKRKPNTFARSLVDQSFEQAERLYSERVAKAKTRGLQVEPAGFGVSPGLADRARTAREPAQSRSSRGSRGGLSWREPQDRPAAPRVSPSPGAPRCRRGGIGVGSPRGRVSGGTIWRLLARPQARPPDGPPCGVAPPGPARRTGADAVGADLKGTARVRPSDVRRI